MISPSYNKPPWRNFDFWSNFVEMEFFFEFGKNQKFDIPLAEIQILDLWPI